MKAQYKEHFFVQKQHQ